MFTAVDDLLNSNDTVIVHAAVAIKQLQEKLNQSILTQSEYEELANDLLNLKKLMIWLLRLNTKPN